MEKLRKEERYKYESAESVEKEYRWDLEACLLGKTVDEYIQRFKEISKEFIALKEEKYKSKELYLKAKKISEELKKNLQIPFQYLSNKRNTNLICPETNRDLQILTNCYHNFEAEYGSEKHLIKKYKKNLREWAELPEFKPYRLSILFSIGKLKYSLNSRIEEYLSKSAKGEINLYDIFSILHDSEIDYGSVKIEGRRVKITDGNYRKLMENTNERIRKTVYYNRERAVTKHRESSAQLLIQYLRNEIVNSKIRGYKSYLHSLVMDDNVNPKLLNTLFKNVKRLMPLFEKRRKLFKKYIEKKYNKKYRV